MKHLLFSYGTLQLEQVQLDTFGRTLNGTKDQLFGYRIEQVEITESELRHADSYEVDDYKRVLASTVSGKKVFIYVQQNDLIIPS